MCGLHGHNEFCTVDSLSGFCVIICVFSVAPCSQVPGTVFSSCGPSCPRSCEDLAVSIILHMFFSMAFFVDKN